MQKLYYSISLLVLIVGLAMSFSPKLAAQSPTKQAPTKQATTKQAPAKQATTKQATTKQATTKQAAPKKRLGDNYCNDSSAMAGNNPDGYISCREDKTCLVGKIDGFCNVDKIVCPDKIPNICFYHF